MPKSHGRLATPNVVLRWLCVSLMISGGVGLCPHSAAAQDRTATPKGNVELVVRKPSGEPAAEVEVVLQSRPWSESSSKRVAPLTANSDAEGKVVVSWPTGFKTLLVSVPGVGYGLTGITYITAEQTARADLPPLAPWAIVKGQIPAEYLKPELKLNWSVGGDAPEFNFPITFTNDGSFRTEVFAGKWRVRIGTEKEQVAQSTNSMELLPGETDEVSSFVKISLDGLVFPQENFFSNKKGKGIVTWASGTVRDVTGQPVPKATVYATVTYHGSIRSEGMVRSTTADEEGKFELKGEGNLNSLSGTLIAHAPGYCPAWNWNGCSIPDPQQPAETAAPVDFVLSKQGGTLEVELEDGKEQVARDWVGLELQNANLRERWARDGVSPERDALEKIVHPVAQADQNGIVRFENLIPGLYKVTSHPKQQEIETMRRFRGGVRQPSGEAFGVAVVQGVVSRYHLALHPQNTQVRFKLFHANGQPNISNRQPFEYSQAESQIGWKTSIKLDGQGMANEEVERSGLWWIKSKYPDPAVSEAPILAPRYCEVNGLLAVSKWLDGTSPAQFTASSLPPDIPAKLSVQVVDEAGQSLPCVVEVGQNKNEPWMIGTTDSARRIRFEGITAGKLSVRPILKDFLPISLGDRNAPLPTDEVLLQQKLLLPVVPVKTEINSDQRLEVRPIAMGYVRGVVKPAVGKSKQDYTLYFLPGPREYGADLRYQSKSGEFVAGPLKPGKVNIRLVDRPSDTTLSTMEVEVAAGQITKIEIVAPATEPIAPQGPRQISLSMAGLQSLGQEGQLLQGAVIRLNDGKTPAFGALAYYLAAEDAGPRAMGLADALGVVQANSAWRYHSDKKPDVSEPPLVPLIVALLPGHSGAVFAAPTPGKPQVFTLPAPQPVSGQITVGGKMPTGMPGQIRILAAYRGPGRLNGLLSVQTVADVDGRFVLAGLTPGKYLVQASLDGIWLSETVSIEPGAQPIADLELAIGAPGGPAAVTLTDIAGSPVPNAAITIDRLAGPLTEMCWPTELFSDGAGRVFIPTLEAGEHTLHVDADGSEHRLTIPSLPTQALTEISIQVETKN